jgi:hypothetical protein
VTVRVACLIAFACVVVAAATMSCARPCRSIAVERLALECQTGGTFNGEIHFDDVPTFEAFLESDQCLPEAVDEERAAVVDSVDFLNNALFIAVGTKGQLQRCIEEREADLVEICDDGLRISFADRISDELPCDGKWTVAFQLPREEMRAAIQD